jgi:hypothetical protein
MSASSTTYSKLKILVAKLFKAEKLYCSMRRVPTNESSVGNSFGHQSQKVRQLNNNIRRINTVASSDLCSSESLLSRTNEQNTLGQSLIEHSNDVRSQEWYKVHHHFRVKLNTIVGEGNTNQINERVSDLWMEFLAEFEIAELDLQECSESARDSLAKEEYSYLFKLSSELIRRKARLQALKVIHDELNTIVSPNGFKSRNNYASLNDAMVDSILVNSIAADTSAISNSEMLSSSNTTYGNVIPLKRNLAS